MQPAFRMAADSDVDTLLSLMCEYYAFDHHPFDRARAETAVRGLLQDPALGGIWLICDREAVVGYVALTFGYSLELLGRDAFVDELFLLESHRRRGWGRQAVAFIEQAARALGVRALHLEVTQHNHNANQFYRKLGFQDREHHLFTKQI